MKVKILAACLFLASSVFSGSMTCTLKPFNVSIGNGHSPNNLYLINETTWFDVGFYDNAWVKGYFAIITLAMNQGKNVTIHWDWGTAAVQATNCESMSNQAQHIRYVRTGNQ